jgi:hypothetical protein
VVGTDCSEPPTVGATSDRATPELRRQSRPPQPIPPTAASSVPTLPQMRTSAVHAAKVSAVVVFALMLSLLLWLAVAVVLVGPFAGGALTGD